MQNETIERIPSVRISPNNKEVADNLGLLADLTGSWAGHGFNLIARPDFEGDANLYLQLNQTHETLKIDPIGSSIPNRGFGQGDIELFGLTYLQKISDIFTGGALHIEPGIWVTQPSTTYPPETASPAGAQIIARMGSIPHGNSLLAQGVAEPFTGTPTLTSPTAQYAFSRFPSFNSVPFATLPTAPPVINAAGSDDAAVLPPAVPFDQYNLLKPSSPSNPRTPVGTTDPPLPPTIDGVGMQTVINDPITLLQAQINKQVADGHTFEGTVLNIATQKSITFRQKQNAPTTVSVDIATAGGGIENMIFLEGGEPVGSKGPNADTALVYATFWIEKVMHPHRPSFMQLQYAQMVVLNFPILKPLATPPVVLGWPHISVATLRKTFS